MGALYKITLPNGKGYVGMTVSDPKKRFAEHRYQANAGREQVIHRAIKKHGGAKFEVLVIASDRKYLEELERKAIVAFGTRSPAGYNCTDGGDGAPVGNQFQLGKKRTDKTKKKMSLSAMGHTRNKGRVHRPEVVEAMRLRAIGTKRSVETKAKMSKAMRGVAHKGCGTSGYVGVSWCKRTNKWRAHITVQGKMLDLGRYLLIDDAIAARQEKESSL